MPDTPAKLDTSALQPFKGESSSGTKMASDSLEKAVANAMGGISSSGPGAGANNAMKGIQAVGGGASNTKQNFKKVEDMVKARWEGGSPKVLDPFFEDGDGSFVMRKPQKAFIYTPISTEGAWLAQIPVDETPFAKFLLESVSYSRSERYHITETFTTSFVSFYGSRPIIYELSGQAYDTQSHNWINEFEENFEKVYRGTMALSFGAKVYVYFGGCILEGYPVSFAVQKHGASYTSARFSMGIIRTAFKRLDTVENDMQGRINAAKSAAQAQAQAGVNAAIKALPGIANKAMDYVLQASEAVNSSQIAGTVASLLGVKNLLDAAAGGVGAYYANNPTGLPGMSLEQVNRQIDAINKYNNSQMASSPTQVTSPITGYVNKAQEALNNAPYVKETKDFVNGAMNSAGNYINNTITSLTGGFMPSSNTNHSPVVSTSKKSDIPEYQKNPNYLGRG